MMLLNIKFDQFCLFISLQKFPWGSICMGLTWQQFDPFPKYGGKIYVRQSDPYRVTP